jgi:hypothetical protein
MTILPQLERDLFNAAQERLPPKAAASAAEQTTSLSRSHTGRFRRTAAGLPLVLSAAVAIAIAIVAIAVLRHGHQATQSATPAGPPGASPRAELIRTFGILRGPQTNADLDRELLSLYLRPVRLPGDAIPPGRYLAISGPPSVLKRWGYPELDRRLVRVVRIPAWTAKVLIAPITFRPSPSSRNRSEGLDLAMWIGTTPTIPPSSLIGTGPQPASLGTLLAHGLALADVAAGKRLLDAVYAVPDGVTSVQLGPFVTLPRQTPPGISRTALNAALGAIHATTTVHDNIGALQLAVPVVTSRVATGPGPAMDGIGTEAQAVWFNSHGQVIKRTTTRVDLIVRVEPKRTG